jgi:hypothetical protein
MLAERYIGPAGQSSLITILINFCDDKDEDNHSTSPTRYKIELYKFDSGLERQPSSYSLLVVLYSAYMHTYLSSNSSARIYTYIDTCTHVAWQ